MKTNRNLSVPALCLLTLTLTCVSMSAQSGSGKVSEPTVTAVPATHFDVSPPLRELLKSQPVVPFGNHVASPPLRPKLALQQSYAARGLYPNLKDVQQSQTLPPVSATVGANVLGVGVGFHGYSVPDAPTDVNLAVGDTQVVEWVNVSYAVFNKADGSYLAGPILGNTPWAGFGGPCETHNSGDIIAQWDKIAHRWILFQPVFSAPFQSCFAISTTPDALGTYFRYAFPQTQGFPDYPKLGNWIDAYYTTQNMFNFSLTAYIGAQPCAFDKNKMLAGDSSATMICVFDNSNGTLFDDGMLPADIDSPEYRPPAGTPEVFLGSIDNFSSETHIYEYTMKPDFAHGTATFTGTQGAHPITVNQYVGLCNFGSSACIPQKGTSSKLDSLADRLMYRLAYRGTKTSNTGNGSIQVNSFMVSHSIANGSTGAMRWYEFRAPNSDVTALTVFQQGTFAPDDTYRWMGSLAMDRKRNIAMGYSRSSSTLFPDIYFTGRVQSDALGSMETEAPIVDQTVATGSQSGTNSRWGDYTSMSIDNDGCTMWYTNQYYTVPNTQFAWSTRVASLRFNSCH